jgi:hypothetical protein
VLSAGVGAYVDGSQFGRLLNLVDNRAGDQRPQHHLHARRPDIGAADDKKKSNKRLQWSPSLGQQQCGADRRGDRPGKATGGAGQAPRVSQLASCGRSIPQCAADAKPEKWPSGRGTEAVRPGLVLSTGLAPVLPWFA